MLAAKEVKVSVWKRLAFNSNELTPELKALLDIAVDQIHDNGDTLSALEVQSIQKRIETYGGDSSKTPDCISGAGTGEDPYVISFPNCFLEMTDDSGG